MIEHVDQVQATLGRQMLLENPATYLLFDESTIEARTLADIKPERLGGLVFTPHPSLSVLSSPHPAATIWAMNTDGLPLSPINDWKGEDTLVVRPHMTVKMIGLSPGTAAFFRHLIDGATLAGAANAARRTETTFDLSTALMILLRSGACTAFNQENSDESRDDV